MRNEDVERLSPEELRQLRARDERVVTLDVRTRDARALHPYAIPGARWLPLAEVVGSAASLPRAGTIVAYCT
jgi:rhodanese-related sulfurtransferase